MSYDVWLEISTGKEMYTIAEVGNYTSNVSPMWGKAIKAADQDIGLGLDGLADMHERQAGDMIEHLQRAVVHMEQNRAEYEELNPSNRWGNYDGALDYLKSLLAACEKHPACTIYISR